MKEYKGKMGVKIILDEKRFSFISPLFKAKDVPYAGVERVEKREASLIVDPGVVLYVYGYDTRPSQFNISFKGKSMTPVVNELYDFFNEKMAEFLPNPCSNSGVHEFKKRCRTCGHVFCYTVEDVEKNELTKKHENLANVNLLINALGGNTLSTIQATLLKGQVKEVRDFEVCPNCGSRTTEDYSGTTSVLR